MCGGPLSAHGASGVLAPAPCAGMRVLRAGPRPSRASFAARPALSFSASGAQRKWCSSSEDSSTKRAASAASVRGLR